MKVSDKLTKINDSITVNIYDNGYMVEIGGRDSDDDWTQVKILCADIDRVFEVIKEASEMERS